MTAKEKLIIFDTTLRDGEQSPGVSLNIEEKVEIAKQLSILGVDVCEAGFPTASQGDFDAVKRIAEEVGGLLTGGRSKPMVICGLARALESDIKRAFDAVKSAPLYRIHTFLATSDIHLEYKLKLSREECVKRVVKAISYCKSLGVTDIEFSCEDAARSDKLFLVTVLKAAIEAGATTLNIPDTVGYMTPDEYGELIAFLVKECGNEVRLGEVICNVGRNIRFSTHCHNDLGLATANTLAGIQHGARQVEVTMNGIGERAGNTSLEEVVMTIHTHPSLYPVIHSIDTYQLYATSQLVTKMTGMQIQPNKAIVGANAFSHESGIHQDGMLKHPQTYEFIDPSIIGLPKKALVLGKHSGRAAFKAHLENMTKGTVYASAITEDMMLNEMFVAFKTLADKRKGGELNDEDLWAILEDGMHVKVSGAALYKFTCLSLMCATGSLATASVTLEVDGVSVCDAATGQGPIDAIFNAVNRIVKLNNSISGFEVRAVSDGQDAPGVVTVKITSEKTSQVVSGKGMDEDILVASAKAYVNAINRVKGQESRKVLGGSPGRNVDV